MPFRLLTLVWRQGNFLSHVNLLLLLYKVTGDAVADNILVMEGMNRGFGPCHLLVVLWGIKRTNNLGIICCTTPPFSINYSFYWFPQGARLTSTGDSVTQWLLIHAHRTQNSVSIVCMACVNYNCTVCAFHVWMVYWFKKRSQFRYRYKYFLISFVWCNSFKCIVNSPISLRHKISLYSTHIHPHRERAWVRGWSKGKMLLLCGTFLQTSLISCIFHILLQTLTAS